MEKNRDPRRDLHIPNNLDYITGGNTNIPVTNGLGQLIIHTGKKRKSEPFSLPHTNMNSSWIKKLTYKKKQTLKTFRNAYTRIFTSSAKEGFLK